MGKTSIEWTTRTWNPIAGCRRVSPGCGKGASPAGCYAENIAVRFAQSEGKAADRWRLVVRYGDCEKCDGTGAVKGKACPKCGGKKVVPNGWNGKFVEIPERLADPLRWREPATVFVNSTSDLFGEGVTDEYIAAVFGVMAATPQHTYQILTKRADRLAKWFEWVALQVAKGNASSGRHLCICAAEERIPRSLGTADAWPLPNVWIGVSVEDQQRADERIPHLLRVPAAVRFLSVEPMLGAIDIEGALASCPGDGDYGAHSGGCCGDHRRIDWIIVGGESGPGARPFALEWAAALSEQCRAAAVPYFFKQGGGNPALCNANLYDLDDVRLLADEPAGIPGAAAVRFRLADKKGGNVAELACLFPDLAAAGVFRREWPEVSRV